MQWNELTKKENWQTLLDNRLADTVHRNEMIEYHYTPASPGVVTKCLNPSNQTS